MCGDVVASLINRVGMAGLILVASLVIFAFLAGRVVLAYRRVLVVAVTAVQGTPEPGWKYLVAVMRVVPAGVVIWLTVRALGRLDEVQKRTQMQALGFSMVATGLITFGYGFLEGVGLPHLNSTYVLPLMAVLWGVGYVALRLRYAFRR